MQSPRRQKGERFRTEGKNDVQIAQDLGIPVNQIATLRAQRLSTLEIARRLGRSERTVYRTAAEQAATATPAEKLRAAPGTAKYSTGSVLLS
jgi:hypothetical protein